MRSKYFSGAAIAGLYARMTTLLQNHNILVLTWFRISRLLIYPGIDMVEDKLVADLLWQMRLQTQHTAVLLHFLLLEMVDLQFLYDFALILISSFLGHFSHCSQFWARVPTDLCSF